jgi:DNA repair photolyase
MNSAGISVSVAFNDNATRRCFESKIVDTEKRIDALRRIKEAGISTGALLCPVIPYITDAFQLIDMLEPHADVIWIYGLSFNDRSDPGWQNVRGILRNHFPDLVRKIETVIFTKDHIYWQQLRESLGALEKDRMLNLRIHV